MSAPKTREEFKRYCLRKLGAPVVQINVADEQLEDDIDDALQYFRDYHYDAQERIFMSHEITQEDLNNEYLVIPEQIQGIVRVYPIQSNKINDIFWNLSYRLRINSWDLYRTHVGAGMDDSTGPMSSYTQTMQYLDLAEFMFTPETPIRYARHTNKLYIDCGIWTEHLNVGDHVIADAYSDIDPVTNPSIWNDRFLKLYTTELFRRTWGNNLSKYNNVQLPGGISLNGEQIVSLANENIKEIQEKMLMDFSGPPEIFIG